MGMAEVALIRQIPLEDPWDLWMEPWLVDPALTCITMLVIITPKNHPYQKSIRVPFNCPHHPNHDLPIVVAVVECQEGCPFPVPFDLVAIAMVMVCLVVTNHQQPVVVPPCLGLDPEWVVEDGKVIIIHHDSRTTK